jgi:hypothetical protein
MNIAEKFVIGFAIIIFLLIAGRCTYGISAGVGVFGPTKQLMVTVETKHVDVSGDSDYQRSHYMVTTDAGVFEVDNGLLLGIWNADEMYGMLKEGRRYVITTEGNRVVNMFFQKYPYIIKVMEVQNQ